MGWQWLLGYGLLAGAVQFAVGFLFYLIVPIVAPWLEEDYRNQGVFRPWEGWTSTYMAVHPVLYGILFAGGFLAIRSRVGASNFGGPGDGAVYGMALFALGSLPVFAMNYASFQVSRGVIVCWVVQSLCQYSLAGLVLGWCCGPAALGPDGGLAGGNPSG